MVRTTIPAAMTKTCPAQRWKRSATASAKQAKRAAEAAAMPGLSETYTSACATPEAILAARAAAVGGDGPDRQSYFRKPWSKSLS